MPRYIIYFALNANIFGILSEQTLKAHLHGELFVVSALSTLGSFALLFSGT